jgi:TonB family protein
MIDYSRMSGRRLLFLAARMGALLLEGGVVAIGPAHASARPQSIAVAAWTAEAERRVDDVFVGYPVSRPDRPAISTVAVTFGKRGYVARARLAHSSGNRTLDYRAIDIARHTDFPRLPVGLRGTPLTIPVRIHFGEDALPAGPEHFAGK